MRSILVLVCVMVLSITACADQTPEFDARLRGMAGSDERQLLGSMGRIPDNTFQLDADTRILQWLWDNSYISPGVAPAYIGGGWGYPYPGYGWGGPWMPIGGVPPDIGAAGLHRRMDGRWRDHAFLPLARPGLRIGDDPQHAAAGIAD